MFWLKVLSEPVRLKPLAILIWDRLITCVQVSVVLNLIPMLVTCISFVTRIQPLCINAEAIFFSMKSTWDVTTRNTHHAAVVPDLTQLRHQRFQQHSRHRSNALVLTVSSPLALRQNVRRSTTRASTIFLTNRFAPAMQCSIHKFVCQLRQLDVAFRQRHRLMSSPARRQMATSRSPIPAPNSTNA